MRTRTKALVTAAGGLLAAWVGWGLYVDRTTERVSYQTIEEFDGVEIRRYPRTLLVETTADDERTAFGRLFRYLSGENAADEEVAMTAPVATTAPEIQTGLGTDTGLGTEISMTAPVRTFRNAGGTEQSGDTEQSGNTKQSEDTKQSGDNKRAGEKLSMTTPVRTTPDSDESSVTMAFYLPEAYDPGTAPTPTDPRVRLVVEPSQTLAVREFSWYATDDRVEENLRKLRDALAGRNYEPRGRPALLRYDDPWTPPFMRRNEVSVEVEVDSESE